MPSIIIPAILTDSLDDFTKKLTVIETLPDVSSIHVDFADGRFVSSQTLLPAQMPALPMKYVFSAHLMTLKPGEYIDALQKAGFEDVAIHYESVIGFEQLREVIAAFDEAGFKVYLTINLDTPIEKVMGLAADIDNILLMGVTPGFQGSKYNPEVEKRVKFLRDHDFYGTITVDGGVSKDNIRALLAVGADNLVVGSAIIKSKGPKESFLELRREAGEII